jgi:hypothetical protein
MPRHLPLEVAQQILSVLRLSDVDFKRVTMYGIRRVPGTCLRTLIFYHEALCIAAAHLWQTLLKHHIYLSRPLERILYS